MKKFAIVIGIVVLALVGWSVFRRLADPAKKQGPGRGARAVVVETAPVGRATVRDVGLYSGTIRAESEFFIAPKIGGQVKQIAVHIGDAVTNGQTVAVLDDEEIVQEVEQNRAALEVAQASVEETRTTLATASNEFSRIHALWEKKIVSDSDHDVARAQWEGQAARYRLALAQVVQREAALKAAEVRLSYTRIRAVWQEDGAPRLVGERFVDEGAMLRANDPILSVIRIRPVTAVIHIIEKDYAKLARNQEVMLTTDALLGRTFTGTIVRVAPLLKESSRQARVEIAVPNPDDALKPGMFVRAQVEFGRRDNATVVPVNALVHRNLKDGVFQPDLVTMTARFVAVEPGLSSEGRLEIVRPPISGDVITLGNHLLEDGGAIRLAAGAEGERPAGPKGSGRKENKP